jgi:hypothetical protein
MEMRCCFHLRALESSVCLWWKHFIGSLQLLLASELNGNGSDLHSAASESNPELDSPHCSLC